MQELRRLSRRFALLADRLMILPASVHPDSAPIMLKDMR
jgi:hypothetical protein